MANIPMIFVSSPRLDLLPEREAILAVLQRLKLPHNSMEVFGADSRPPLKKCLSEVEDCDIFVIVLGHRYGSVSEPEGLSFTELEYRRALECKKPVLAYIKDESVRVLPRHFDNSQTGIDKLRELKDNLQRQHTVSYFKSDVDLVIQLAIDLKGIAQNAEGASASEAPPRLESQASREAFDDKRSAKVLVRPGYAYDLSGFQMNVEQEGYQVTSIDRPLDNAALKDFGIIVLTGSGHKGGSQFSSEEIVAISAFVDAGGGLLCAGQAWSWCYDQYGNKPVELFPLNVLGRKLGFQISGENVGAPNPDTADENVFGRFKDWKHLDQWAPSRVEATAAKVKPVLEDGHDVAIAVSGEYGFGRFVVLGHERMLQYNPEIGASILNSIRPKASGV